MKKKVRANIILTLSCDDAIEGNNIMHHLKSLIDNNINDRLEIVNIDNISVKQNVKKRRTIKVDQAARNFIEAVERNIYPMWTPNFENKVNTVILSPSKLTEESGEQTNFDGIILEMAILKEKLGIEEDF